MRFPKKTSSSDEVIQKNIRKSCNYISIFCNYFRLKPIVFNKVEKKQISKNPNETLQGIARQESRPGASKVTFSVYLQDCHLSYRM